MSFAGMGHNRSPDQKQEPDCYCATCDKEIHHLGIMSHRAAHRRRNEKCVIEYSDGRVITHDFTKS